MRSISWAPILWQFEVSRIFLTPTLSISIRYNSKLSQKSDMCSSVISTSTRKEFNFLFADRSRFDWNRRKNTWRYFTSGQKKGMLCWWARGYDFNEIRIKNRNRYKVDLTTTSSHLMPVCPLVRRKQTIRNVSTKYMWVAFILAQLPET